MAKTYLSTVKYVIKTDFTVEGIVDKHDIIGAIFGQSEGLIGEEMDLKELQRNGKLGRIEVETQTKSGKTFGKLTIPSSLDKVQTSILAAAIESVDKVGPCNSLFKTDSIEDARQEKRKAVTERAKEILKQMSAGMPETQELTEAIIEKTRTGTLREIGREKVPVGPEADSSSQITLVEGRADVINMLKHGIKNVAGVGGANVPKILVNMVKGKEVTVFVDGDRGGDLIARQLSQAMKVDFIAKAPDGKEVEELTLKEILAALRKKDKTSHALRPARPRFEASRTFEAGRTRFPSQRGRRPFQTDRRNQPGHRGRRDEKPGGYRGRRDESFKPRTGSARRFGSFRRTPEFEKRLPLKPNDLGQFSQAMQELEGTLKARFLDEKTHATKEINVRDLLKEMQKHKNANAIVLDGIITKRLLLEAEKNKVKQLIGVKR